MFWKKRTPINHDSDTCRLCGSSHVTGIFKEIRTFRHTRDDCLKHIRFIADAAYRRIRELERNEKALATILLRIDKDGSKVVTDIHGRIVTLENANKDIACLLRKSAEKMDVLLEKYAPIIAKFYTKGPPNPLPKPKARPKK